MSDDDNKPALDEQTFAKLLEAAHVLQEHGRSVRDLQERMELHSERLREQQLADHPAHPANPPAPAEVSRPDDYTLTLAEVVEVQRQIQLRRLDLNHAVALIAEKVAHMTNASGAGVAILDGRTVRYRAGAGPTALPVGSEIPLSNAICAASIRTGQVIRSEDVNTEVLFDPEPCRQRGISSLLVVPIYHDGDIVGGLELYFDRLRGYAEQDIHTCRLLAGLITEAIGREAEQTLKKSVAEERSTMLAAIEKLQPNLAALAGEHPAPPATYNGAAGAVAQDSTCSKCGKKFPADEQFCENCGAPRVADAQASLQSKLASAWQKQQAEQETHPPVPAASTPPPPVPDHDFHAPPLPDNLAEAKPENSVLRSSTSASDVHAKVEDNRNDPFSPRPLAVRAGGADSFSPVLKIGLSKPSSSRNRNEGQPHFGDEPNDDSSQALVRIPENAEEDRHPELWTSAAKTRDFLESLAGSQNSGRLINFWRAHRGDFYLAVAVVLVIVVIRWGVGSAHSVVAREGGTTVSAGNPQPSPPDANLSPFDKLLVRLGLAEAPEPPQDKGNPDIQVWVDLHTALYYCPGADLYGKTPKGKLTTQRNAQLDQFEPANRKPCQ